MLDGEERVFAGIFSKPIPSVLVSRPAQCAIVKSRQNGEQKPQTKTFPCLFVNRSSPFKLTTPSSILLPLQSLVFFFFLLLFCRELTCNFRWKVPFSVQEKGDKITLVGEKTKRQEPVKETQTERRLSGLQILHFIP